MALAGLLLSPLSLSLRPVLPSRAVARPVTRSAVVRCAEDGPPRLSAAEVVKVGELVADDEWQGLSMELSQACSAAVREQLKAMESTIDITKELDEKVNAQVAQLRGKEDYEFGDLSKALADATKAELCKITGKDDYARRTALEP